MTTWQDVERAQPEFAGARRRTAGGDATGVPLGLLDANGVQLRSTPIDPQKVAELIVSDSTFPDVRSWVAEYVLEPYSDVDAVLGFASRDGRSERWND